jgi:hypothetical protein
MLHLKTIIYKANDIKLRSNALESLNVIMDLVLCCKSTNLPSELDFAIGSLLSIYSTSVCDEYRADVLSRLKALVIKIMEKGKIISEINANKLVLALMHIHEQNRSNLIKFYQTRLQIDYLHKQLCMPLIPVDGDSSATLQNVVHASDPSLNLVGVDKKFKVPESIIACVETSYDILSIILDRKHTIFPMISSSLGELPMSKTDVYSGTLRCISDKCCLNNLVEAFEQARQGRNEKDLIHRVKTLCTRCVSVRKGLKDGLKLGWDGAEMDASLSPEIRYLRLSLLQVNDELQKCVLDGSPPTGISSHLMNLARELTFLCRPELPLDMKEAAIKCLGYLGLYSDFFRMEFDVTEDGLEYQDNLLVTVYCSASRLLVSMLQSDQIDTANHAKDIIKFLVTTTDGYDAFHNPQIPVDSRQILSSFMTKNATMEAKLPELPFAFYKKTLSIAEKNEDSDCSWCWDDKFWRLPHELNLTYEDWIKHIVCALILCCYNRNGVQRNLAIKGTSTFIPSCLSMCASKFDTILLFCFDLYIECCLNF